MGDAALPPETGWAVGEVGLAPPVELRYPPSYAAAASEEGPSGFCNGIGTDMHMQGFVSLGQPTAELEPCVILLFRSWMLENAAKFVLAALGVVGTGVFSEFVTSWRRKEPPEIVRRSPGLRKA